MIRTVINRLNELTKMLKTKGSFVQNFAMVFSGKTIAMLLGIATTPIIARLFRPEAYGVFAIYFLVVSNLSIISTLRLPMGFILIRDEKEYKNVLGMMHFFMILFLVFACVVFFFSGEIVFEFLGNKQLQDYWYLVIIGVILHSLSFSIGSWNSREKAFKESTFVSLTEAASIKGSNISLGFFTGGIIYGLIVGDIIGKFLNLVVQKVIFVKKKWTYLIPSFNVKRNFQLLKKYKEYPTVLLPNAWIGMLSNNIILIFVSRAFESELLGQLSMSLNLIFIPVGLIANTTQPVLMQKITELGFKKLSYNSQLIRYVNSIIYISTAIVFVIITIGGPFINLFLGKDWNSAANIILTLSPTILFQILYLSLAGILISLEKRKSLLTIEFVRFLLLLLLFITIDQLTNNFDLSILIYSIAYCAITIILIARILVISGVRNLEIFFIPLIIYLVIVFISFTLHFLI